MRKLLFSVMVLGMLGTAFAMVARMRAEVHAARIESQALAQRLARAEAEARSTAALKEENAILLETLRVADADALAQRYAMRDAVADSPRRPRALPGYSH